MAMDWCAWRFADVPGPSDGGLTHLTDRLSGHRRCVRKVANGPLQAMALQREVALLLKLRHPAFRGVRAVSEGEAVMEHVEGATLDVALRQSPNAARPILVDLLRALVHLHSQGVVHGDLKPANILVNSVGHPQLIDLGLAVPLSQLPSGGTRGFLPPEYLRGGKASVAGDLYALGFCFSESNSFDDGVREFVAVATSKDPSSRPASAETALATMAVFPRPVDRQGQLPLLGADELFGSGRRVIERFRGERLVIAAQPGQGTTRFLEDLRRGCLSRGQNTADCVFSLGFDPILELGRVFLEGGRGASVSAFAADFDFVSATTATVRELASRSIPLLIDGTEADEDGLRTLHRVVSASRNRGAVVLVVTPEVARGFESASSFSNWSLADVASARTELGGRDDPELLTRVHERTGGRPGLVVRMLELAVAHPEWTSEDLCDSIADQTNEAESVLADLDVPTLLQRGAGRRALRVLEHRPPGARTAELRARAYIITGDLVSAIDEYRTLGEKISADGRLRFAEVLERSGRSGEVSALVIGLLETPEYQARAALCLATAKRELGETQRAWELADLAGQSAVPTLRARAALLKSDLRLLANEPQEALEYAVEASALSGTAPRLRAQAESRRAAAYSALGDWSASLSGYARALEFAELAGETVGLPPYLMNVAVAHHGKGEFGHAILRYEEAAALALSLGRKGLAAAALINLAGMLTTIGAENEAARVLARAETEAEGTAVPIYAAQSVLVGAEITRVRDPRAAREESLQAANMFRSCGAARQALEARLLVAEISSELKEPPDGELFHDEAALREAGLWDRALRLRAAGERAANQANAAEATLLAALALARSSANPILLVDLYLDLVQLKSAQGRDAAIERSERKAVVDEVAESLPIGLKAHWVRSRDSLTASASGAPATKSDLRIGLSDDARRLLSLARRVLVESDERRLFELALDEVVDLTRAERAFLLRHDAKGRSEVVAARNLDRETVRKSRFRFSKSVAERVISTGEPLLTASAAEDPELTGARSIHDLGLRSILCVPIRGPERVVGALYVDHRFESGHFEAGHVEVVSAFADLLGLALENGRLHRDARAREQDLGRAQAALEEKALRQAAEVSQLNQRLRSAGETVLDDRAQEYGILGTSPKLRRCISIARRVAPSELPVLLEGESGTGKELFARFIHGESLRAKGPFVAINCAAMSEQLLESELFGHVRGAFTGAIRDYPGLFRAAENGTFFLDEIGEMPLRMQTRLLRVLQEGEVRPVGGSSHVQVNARILCATNRKLEAEVEEGRFRQDLFFRLAGAHLELPSLRERREDIMPIAAQLLGRMASEPGMSSIELSKDALRRLLVHSWPGNVRELEQTLRRASLLAPSSTIEEADLQLGSALGMSRHTAIRKFDRGLVQDALSANNGNRTRTAKALGVSRVTLYRWMKRYELS